MYIIIDVLFNHFHIIILHFVHLDLLFSYALCVPRVCIIKQLYDKYYLLCYFYHYVM